jgi:hypothetical protein
MTSIEAGRIWFFRLGEHRLQFLPEFLEIPASPDGLHRRGQGAEGDPATDRKDPAVRPDDQDSSLNPLPWMSAAMMPRREAMARTRK